MVSLPFFEIIGILEPFLIRYREWASRDDDEFLHCFLRLPVKSRAISHYFFER